MLSWNVHKLEITSASIPSLLTQANQDGIDLRNIRYIDDLNIVASVSGVHYAKLKKLTEKRGDYIKNIDTLGAYFSGLHILRRPVLLLGIIVWIFLVLYLPTRVLFVYVDGNKDSDTAGIIEAASNCGIHFGASRRYVRSEAVKNALLSEIGTLQWVGVNTRGCVAIISVKERSNYEEATSANKVSSIVATQDGVISSITTTSGNPICKVGQAVRKGQILVSAFTDCGISVKADSAEAEIFAITSRSFKAMTLASGLKRTVQKETLSRYSIQIGKNIVKLYNDSGILDTSCVKMYSQQQLTLPGGFQLPVALNIETYCFYDCEPFSPAEESEYLITKQLAEGYLRSTMISGKIIGEAVSGELQNGTYLFNGVYTCEEMIGQKRVEETLEHNGEGNR